MRLWEYFVMLRKQLRGLRINIFLERMLTEVSYWLMLGLTLFKIFINTLNNAIKCCYCQALKCKPEETDKKQNCTRATSRPVTTQESTGEGGRREV